MRTKLDSEDMAAAVASVAVCALAAYAMHAGYPGWGTLCLLLGLLRIWR